MTIVRVDQNPTIAGQVAWLVTFDVPTPGLTLDSFELIASASLDGYQLEAIVDLDDGTNYKITARAGGLAAGSCATSGTLGLNLGGGGETCATVFEQHWPVVEHNAGAFRSGDGSFDGDGDYESVAIGGTDPVDPNYPKLVLSTKVQVTTVDVDNWLAMDALEGAHGFGSFVWLWPLGTEEGKPSAPIASGPDRTNVFWNASKGSCRCDHVFGTGDWNFSFGEPTALFPLFALDELTLGSGAIYFNAHFDFANHPTTFTLYVFWYGWSSGGPNLYVTESGTLSTNPADAKQFPRSEFEGIRHRFAVAWRCGTIEGAWDNVAADGFLRVLLDDVVIGEATDLDLYMSGSFEVLHHQSSSAMITVALHDGRATDLVIESCTTGVTGEVYTVLRPEIEMPRGDGIFLTWVEVGFRS